VDPVQILTWVIIVVFALTALITLGGIVESFEFIQVKEEYLHKLFPVLLLEIVAICIPIAGEELRCDEACMFEKIKNLDPSSNLARDILEMRKNFEGIFVTPEYKIEISFGELSSPKEAKVCPQGPLYYEHVMVFNNDRNGGTNVIAFSPEPQLCTDSNMLRIEISQDWANKEFGLNDEVTGKIEGWGRIMPPMPL
jgi:hypothetical protein